MTRLRQRFLTKQRFIALCVVSALWFASPSTVDASTVNLLSAPVINTGSLAGDPSNAPPVPDSAACTDPVKYAQLLLGLAGGNWGYAVEPWLSDEDGTAACGSDDDGAYGYAAGRGGNTGTGQVAGGFGGGGASGTPSGSSAPFANGNTFGVQPSFDLPDTGTLDDLFLFPFGDLPGADERGEVVDLLGGALPSDSGLPEDFFGVDPRSFSFSTDSPEGDLVTPVPVPEPGSFFLLATGLAPSIWALRRRFKNKPSGE